MPEKRPGAIITSAMDMPISTTINGGASTPLVNADAPIG
jgi:hypothetical protein